MEFTADYLAAARRQIDADDVPLKEARVRLQLVRDIAEGLPGAPTVAGRGRRG